MVRLVFFYSFICLLLLLSGCFSSSFERHLCSPIEASALLQFKQSFQIMSKEYFSYWCDGASFPKTNSWNESRDCCTWDGVTCDLLSGHVIALELSCSLLNGTIHPNSSLFQLNHLHTLNLAKNNFNWFSIPNGIGRLTNLRHLNLSHSSFNGKIPTEISYLSNLVSLDLSGYGLQLDERTFETMLHNFTTLELLSLHGVNISSPIPVNLSTSLRYVNLEDTYLQGVLTERFFLLPKLENLKLGGNHLLKGVFPKIHLSKTLLMELDISDTGISGELPDSIGTFSSLNILNLHDCHFSGRIPDSIGNLTQIRELVLSHNYFTDHIPSTISKLKQLTRLHLSDNSLSGEIPDIFSNLKELVYLDLSSNSFSGGVFSNLQGLHHLDLSDNSLSGEIPDVFSNVKELVYLDLSSNSFSGKIPGVFSNLPALHQLDLSYNSLSGEIPDVFSNLKELVYLDLSDNFLSGEILDIFSNLQELRYLLLSSNSFSGKILDVFSNLQELRYLDLSNNSFIGPFPCTILNLSSNSLSSPLPNNESIFQKLRELNLSYNSLNGTIPSWVFSLPMLSWLRLHNNQLSGLANEIKSNPTFEYLDLSHNQFSGSFPQSLANLTNLSSLDLSSNNITSDAGINITFPSLEVLQLSSCELKDFPHFLTNVKTLSVLDISNNMICGQIPNWLIRWDSLEHLNISYNCLTGHLEQVHSYMLQSLDLKFNFLEGPLSSSICNMSRLRFIDLSHNNFSNSIPSCLGSMTPLTVLDLRRNDFTGNLPPLCSHSTLLSTIVLNGNRIGGHVPKSLLNCDYLKIFDVGNNAISDTFPAWLGTLQVLQVLILKSNKFHGPISTCQTMFCFPMLRIFDLSRNEFSGSLPAKVFENFKAMIKLDGEDTGEIKYMKSSEKSSYTSYEDSVSLVIKGNDIDLERITTIMTTIDLSSNHFEGVIPKILKDLSSLWLLNLSHNNLKGDIPMELGQLNTLEALDLSWNRLTGKIPQELTRIKFLAFLNLSQNLLIGPIPRGPQFNTFENDSYGGNLDLCGHPLSKQCRTSDSSHAPQPLESEEDEDESYFLSGFTWESVVIGYSFGLVAGTVAWSLIFKYRKPKWFVEFFEGIFPKKMRRSKKRRPRRRT